MNGLPTTNWTSGNSLTLPTIATNFAAGVDIFAVFQQSSAQGLIDLGNETAGPNFSNDIIVDVTNSSGFPAFLIYNGGGSSQIQGSSALTSQWQMFEANQAGASTGTISSNGVQLASGGLNNPNNVSRANNLLGYSYTRGGFLGNLSELLVYNRSLNSFERASLMGYLSQRYQLPVTATVPAPTFSVSAGSLSGPTQVAISSRAGSIIYYTLDGTTPTTSSPIYTGPVNVTYTLTINAIAVQYGISSSMASAAYILNFNPWPAPSPQSQPPVNIYLQLPTNAIP
jgi:hypothetical protein